MDLLFYDIECYPFDSFVVFKDINKKVLGVFTDKDRFKGLSSFIKGKTLVGYNNYFYDDFMLESMLNGWDAQQLKALNDDIIHNRTKRYFKGKFKSIDTFQQIDVGMPSLKKIEGNMGKMILESSIPFDVDHELSEEEFQEAYDYCCYDVDTTIEVYKMRVPSYFEPKQSLVDMVGKGERWNTTTLSANALLGDITLQKWSDIRLNSDDFKDLSMLELVPSEVVDMWNSGNDKGKVTIEEFDCSIEFGFGGLHGVHKSIKKVENLVMLDVASMYPHIILIINALGKATEKYNGILEQRIKIKHQDKILSDALKLILNSVYGNLKNKYSPLYNPKAALSVCIYGQIALYTLCKQLSKIGTIININTDGVGFIPHGEYEHIWHEWEDQFNLTLEEDSFDLLIQRDVNNYIGVKDGKITKCKGGDTSRYHYDQFFKNNSARILDIALVDHLVYGKSVIATVIEKMDDPKLYQYIIKAGSTYKGTFDQGGNKYNKINRIFPTGTGDLCLYKKRQDDGLVKFADAPEKMFVWNEDVDKLDRFESIVDLNHYVQIINKRLEKWVL